MKIALMTWFHYDNYGSVLQAAALRRVLQSYGHSVDVIAYFPGERMISIPVKGHRSEYARKRIRAKVSRNPVITSAVSGEAFETFREKNFTFTAPCETLTDLEELCAHYDAFVCGSGQIWHPKHFDPRFFLDFVRDPQRMIAYAPSILPVRGADPYVLEQMKELIGRFLYISVREESGRKFMSDAFATTAMELADPTLLIEPDDWDGSLQITGNEEQPGERYMLVLLEGVNRTHRDAAAKLASRLLLSRIIIPIHESDLKQEDVIQDAVGPAQLVSLIRNANYVCTDSYHATALAIVFQKEFCCFDRYAMYDRAELNERVHDLLDALGLQSRLYNPETSIEQYIKPIDYIPVNYKLDAFKSRSRAFLKDSLEKVASHVAMSVTVPKHVLQDHELCTGCGACVGVCAGQAIRVEMTKEGFYRAIVDEEKCSLCEACRSVCPFDGPGDVIPVPMGSLLTYQDEQSEFREGCSAGGAAARLAWLLKRKGYAVAGCALGEEDGMAAHVLIYPDEPDEKLETLKGIKLMTSNMMPLYEQLLGLGRGEDAKEAQGDVQQAAGEDEGTLSNAEAGKEKEFVEVPVASKEKESVEEPVASEEKEPVEEPTASEEKEAVEEPTASEEKEFREKPDVSRLPLAIFATPCQIAGARALLKGRQDVVFIEIECPGVPSALLRTKRYRSGIFGKSAEDALLEALGSGLFYNEACYSCRWRRVVAGDIRIGSAGVGDDLMSRQNYVTVMTDRGRELINDLLISGFWEGLHKKNMREEMTKIIRDNPPLPAFYAQAFAKLKEERTSLNRMLKDYVRPALR